ncbi:MAG: tetratricopeptide repeat protein [Muribaculaceae bacterium]|nr:tetratricopeptide repeat protein [Muribaculaceae bacterium]
MYNGLKLYRGSAGVPWLIVVAIFVATALGSCSPTKNNAATRRYQEFITRYNIYYNGDKHFQETLDDMERKYEDDYSRLVFMHPVEAKADKNAPQPTGDFDRSIEKGQKAIQLRSIKKKPPKKAGRKNDAKYQAWMKREEYNPFLHNAWMLMGRGQYYNGDFLGAASTFFYVSKHFTWLPATVMEAKLMQALSYVSMGWQYEAEMILVRIKHDDLINNRLRRLYNYAYADYYVHSGNYENALPFLIEAVKGASGAQKIRLNFLLGQVYARLGDNDKAYKAFGAAGGAPSATYRTKFNARIKQSEVFSGSDIEAEVKSLRRMTRYDRNKEYLDQIYYAIGNLYLSRGDTLKAIENYEIANEKSTRNGIDKAINQLRLGELYFLRHNYAKAQPSYAEAVPQLPESYPNYAAIKRRSDVLDELAVYSENVNLQDSLLRLSAMTQEERLVVINKIIAELKEKEKKEAEEARREEYLANQAAMGNRLQDNSTQSFTINSDNSWYFYNTATKNAGKTEFQKRWGSRKLEDDWRRRNKASFNTDDFDSADKDELPEEDGGEGADEVEKKQKDEGADKASDPHYPEYYLAQIPETDEDKATAHEVIQEGLYNMGLILKDKLEDYGASLSEFNRLLKDYPDNVYRLDVYYNIYLMFVRQGKMAEAERFRAMILSDFADSKYGVAMRDPNYIENLRTMDARQQELYESTYQAYLDNRNADVHQAYATMNEKYPLSKIMPKFMFLDALAYVTEKKPEQFNTVLRDLLDRYPDTDITPIAVAWLKGMAQGRQLQSAQANMRGMIWDMRLSNDSTAVADNYEAAEFTLNPEEKQLLIFTFPTDVVSSNALLFEIARHNFRSFVVKDFDLEQMNFGRLGMIIVRGFDNMPEINHYRSVMASSEDFKLPAGVRPIVISEANFKILLDEGRSFEEYFHYLDAQNYVDAQAGILEAEDIEQLEEPAAGDDVSEPADEAGTQESSKIILEEEIPQAEPEEIVASQAMEPAVKTPSPATQAPTAPATASSAIVAPAAVPATVTPTPAPMLPPGSEGDDDPLLFE